MGTAVLTIVQAYVVSLDGYVPWRDMFLGWIHSLDRDMFLGWILSLDEYVAWRDMFPWMDTFLGWIRTSYESCESYVNLCSTFEPIQNLCTTSAAPVYYQCTCIVPMSLYSTCEHVQYR